MRETVPPNPVREGLHIERRAEPCALVIFGATGDLGRRKLVPALYSLSSEGHLHADTAVVGVARREQEPEAFRKVLREAVEQHARRRPARESEWEAFASGISYFAGRFEDPGAYAALGDHLAAVERARGTGGNRVFYLATPPSAYPAIVRGLAAAGLVARGGAGGPWTRIVVEKPFGRDLASARELNALLGEVFAEEQIYRIDHYLGKETVQNILVFRLANGIFEPLWNQRYVDHVQITVAESVGVEKRAAYYEEAGVSRDILQNHLLQLLTLVAMEPPVEFAADAIRDEKVKVLKALRPLEGEEVKRRTVRAQYGPGAVGGQAVPGYREEAGVSPSSTTETFLALRCEIDNWRWAGAPFYLRSGKRLPNRVTEIAIIFRRPPHATFRSVGAGALEQNVLALRIQPDEGISLSFGSKAPGQAIHIDPVRMDFHYATSFGGGPPEAYERLLWDCVVGDSTLFARRDEVELAWSFVDAMRVAWERCDVGLARYEAGSWGPPEAGAMIREDGRRWRRL